MLHHPSPSALPPTTGLISRIPAHQIPSNSIKFHEQCSTTQVQVPCRPLQDSSVASLLVKVTVRHSQSTRRCSKHHPPEGQQPVPRVLPPRVPAPLLRPVLCQVSRQLWIKSRWGAAQLEKMQKKVACVWRYFSWQKPFGRAGEAVLCSLRRKLAGWDLLKPTMDWDK